MKKEITIAVVSAVLAFVGSALGVFLTFTLTNVSWERQIHYDEQRLALEQRLGLVERLAKVVAHFDEAEKNHTLIAIDGKARAIALQQGESAAVISEMSERLANRLIEIEAEYSAVLTLLQIHFGPKTRHAITPLIETETWFQPNKDHINALYDAIQEELYWFE